MRTMLVSTLAAVMLMLSGWLHATATVEGIYLATGHNPNGSTYQSVLEIQRRGAVYYARWTSPREEPVYGVGFLHRDVLVLSYGAGAAAYPIKRGKITEGLWTVDGAMRIFPESLRPLPLPPAPPPATAPLVAPPVVLRAEGHDGD